MCVASGQATGGSHKLAVSTAIVDRLRRRLRSNGFRAHLTLQMVPEDDDLISNVHITPLRASRALALRFLANKFNLDMESITVSFLPCSKAKQSPYLAASSSGKTCVCQGCRYFVHSGRGHHVCIGLGTLTACGSTAWCACRLLHIVLLQSIKPA